MNRKNGINMLDVKMGNRSAILELIYRSKGIPRKDIAKALGLTPAAITLITNDLINEGILIEADTRVSAGRGRKEILLEIDSHKYASIGVSITRHHFELICIDLSCKILFQKMYKTSGLHHDAGKILACIAEEIRTSILHADFLAGRQVLGIGASTLGVVDSKKGISVNSYGVFEGGSTDIRGYFEKELHLPVILTNNICACAHGEAFLSNFEQRQELLFIKYGPGIGSALLKSNDHFSVQDYTAVQIGHVIMDPNGRPCICGNQGCLETIISYDSIIHSISDLVSERLTPELDALVKQDPENLNMKSIMESYDLGNPIITAEIDRVIFYLVIAIKNAITLLNPESVILYGELFENLKFRRKLVQQLSAFTKTQKVAFSDFNLGLETLGPATTMISSFLLSGGDLKNTVS